MIKWKTVLLDFVIGRRGISNTASSLWPCQNPSRKFYIFGIVLLILGFIQAAQVMGAEKTIPAEPPATAEATQSDAPVPMTDIHDIRPPVPVGIDAPWLMPVLLVLTVLVILAALFWWWKKHRRQPTVETIVPELPPEMTALRSLDEIADVRRLDGKTFYFRLSAILRQYVYGRFSVGAPEMTTEEFLPCINQLPIDGELARQLKGLSRAMDPVKFGGAITTEKQMEADLLFARGFVRRTTETIDMDDKEDRSDF
jgi:hypothetical protein